ncbi:MAG: GH3 auxin-responsive promoter family protein [Bacteroidetes bacterium]|nr:GH3 auxin-responsive promoter family protein [Bacteroidota bacterium]
MPIINSIASWFMKKRMHQIELFMKYPNEVQNEWLERIVNKGKDTEFGKKYNLKTASNAQKFKENVPLNDYETLKPYIERMRHGEQNLLLSDEVVWYAKSSGTTDKSKFIPLSQEFLDACHYNGGRDMVTLHCINNPNTQLFTGKNLALGGSFKAEQLSNFTSYHGDVSAIIIQNLPMWAEFFRAPHVNIALLEKWEDKLDKIAKSMSDENVTSIAGVPSWMLVLLKHILAHKKVKNIHDVWPNLEVYFHGGVGFSPYRKQFDDLFFGGNTNYLELYNASEGFFGIQDLPNTESMLLMLDYGIYYEFIPSSEWSKTSPNTISLSDVKVGQDYALVITTTSGLWRYQIGDIICFTELKPFRFIISGRTKQFINVFGEELMIHNAESALKKACEKTHALVVEYTVAPIFMNQTTGAHEWLIEFEKLPNNTDFFVAVLDDELKKLNSDYEAKRYNNYVLHLPKLTIAQKGIFYKWLNLNNKLGGQFKIPRLNNSRKYIDEILNLL